MHCCENAAFNDWNVSRKLYVRNKMYEKTQLHLQK